MTTTRVVTVTVDGRSTTVSSTDPARVTNVGAAGPAGADGAAGADGTPGVDGDTFVPDPTAEPDDRWLTTAGGALVYADAPAGGASDASDVAFTPTGAVAATDVQAAIAELDTEKSGTAHTHSYQPVDSDLTAIAALSTTAFGRALLELANAAAGRTALGLGTAAVAATGDFDAAGAAAAAQAASQPLDSDLTALAALSTTSYGRSLLEAANAAALRTLVGLVLGTDIYSKAAVDSGFQPLDSDLTSIAALTTTSTGRSLLAAADAAALRTILGLGTAALISSTAGGDLSGTLPSPTVAKINGVAVTGTPSVGYVPTATSSSAATWQAASGGATIHDRRWTTPSGWTSIDEFNDDSLNAGWTRVDEAGASSRAVWTEAADVLSVAFVAGDSTSKFHAQMRALSSFGGALAVGDAAVGHLTLFTSTNASLPVIGLCIGDGVTSGSGDQVSLFHYPGSTGTFTTRGMTGYTADDGNSSGALALLQGIPYFVRIGRITTNTWRGDISIDGVSWVPTGTITKTFTPTHAGFIVSSYGAGSGGFAAFEFLRRMSGVT